ncbi:MAG: thiol oxidoreductase [Planctomycetes bacterium]|nr:thiol oxidoreductase [Planctomycetota bacterium]
MRASWPPAAAAAAVALFTLASFAQVGGEKALPQHLADGEEYTLPLDQLVRHGQAVFEARWTPAEGFGRPGTKGTGAPLSDPSALLDFPRSMNRVSGPDANSCAGCHNVPRSGGGGDFVANVFVLGQRFDFATSGASADGFITKGTTDESGSAPTLQAIANSRNTLGMFGSGYIEMLARQITAELQAIRDAIPLGGSAPLVARGIDFGTLAREAGGAWETSAVAGLPAPSLASVGGAPPSLVIMPFHQAGAVVSLRQFSNNAYNHHHGIQSSERFGAGTDPDGDGIADELTRADVTAVTVFQACLPVPGRVIPRAAALEQAISAGEKTFVEVGCATCHIPELPLVDGGWKFSEPNPYNPPGNLRPQDVSEPLVLNLNSKQLERPRLAAQDGVTWVPCFTDFKLHDVTSGPADPNHEPLDMLKVGSAALFQGNSRFLTRKLWGVANEPPYFHHGMYSTLREAVEAHAGEAHGVMDAFHALSTAEQDEVIEFLKTLQVLPPDARGRVLDENGKRRKWHAFPYDRAQHLPPK